MKKYILIEEIIEARGLLAEVSRVLIGFFQGSLGEELNGSILKRFIVLNDIVNIVISRLNWYCLEL